MISMIFAISSDNKIGDKNKLLWHIPEDLKRFKLLTKGKKLLMGRKTFESLPFLLKGRHHIILTRDSEYTPHREKLKQVDETTTYEVITTLEDVIKYNQYENTEDGIMVIGGSEIYKQIFNRISKIYCTYVDKEYPQADTELDLDFSNFKNTYQSDIMTHKGLEYMYINLEKSYN